MTTWPSTKRRTIATSPIWLQSDFQIFLLRKRPVALPHFVFSPKSCTNPKCGAGDLLVNEESMQKCGGAAQTLRDARVLKQRVQRVKLVDTAYDDVEI